MDARRAAVLAASVLTLVVAPGDAATERHEVLVGIADLSVLPSLPPIERKVSDTTFVVATGDPGRLAGLPGVTWVAPDVVYSAARAPDDPCWRDCEVMPGGQANLQAIGAEAAWDVSTGSADVAVAVIDTLVDPDHPDLRGKVRVGPDHRPTDACVARDATLRAHGTAVASVVAASTDDGAGIAGIGWSTSILAVPALDDCGDGTAATVAAAINSAVEQRARIINLSVTGPAHPAVEDAVRHAREAGVLVVAAAGNDSSTAPSYPAAYPSVVAVGSTARSNEELSWFSTRGEWVDMAAPGERVLAASAALGGYWIYDGTSFAAPLVAGSAALLLTVHPHFDADDLEYSLARSARRLAGDPVAWGTLDAAELLGQHAGALVMADARGGVLTYGTAPFHGSLGDVRLAAAVVGVASSPGGYRLVGADGGVFAFGDASYLGGAAGIGLRAPIVGIASTPTGRGYWLVGADGGVFAFGDAPFAGSAGSLALRAPIVGMAPTPTGRGYWLAAADGGVFAFGDARFGGAATPSGAPIVGIAAARSSGYWLVDRTGVVSAFGGAPVASQGDRAMVHEPVVGIVAARDEPAYWLITAAGRAAAVGHVLDDGRVRPLPSSRVVAAAASA